MRVFDSFLFFNELDLLEIRLNTLDEHVDYFVISEFNITFSGLPKPYYFEENKERFAKFKHKIIYIKQTLEFDDFHNLQPKMPNTSEHQKVGSFFDEATHFPKNEKHWCRDFFHRECLRLGLVDCHDDDLVMFSDIDEIPNPKWIEPLKHRIKQDEIYRCLQDMYYYYLNVLKEKNWKGTSIALYGTLKQHCLNSIRMNDWNFLLSDGGWHFSFLGDPEHVKHKLICYSHQEYNRDDIKDSIEDNINNLRDIFGRQNTTLTKVDIDNSFPDYIVNNKEKYSQFIKC
jgi:beta-1,4-mannosyl-glycoprotein beta-1,4-N-acetylglucosaminyltransferase